MHFTLKLVDATEHHLETGMWMCDLSDLRKWAFRELDVPIELQSHVHHGRNYTDASQGEYVLNEILNRATVEPGQERIIWLYWMSDEHWISVCPRRGGMFLDSEYPRKEALNLERYPGQPFDAVRLRVWKSLMPRGHDVWRAFHQPREWLAERDLWSSPERDGEER